MLAGSQPACYDAGHHPDYPAHVPAPSATHVFAIPDFRNLGVMLRILLSLNLLLLCSALFQNDGDGWLRILAVPAGPSRPCCSAWACWGCCHPGWPAAPCQHAGAIISMLCVVVQDRLLNPLELPRLDRPLLAGLLALLLLHYFSLRQRALSPALGEARLAALQARIRPTSCSTA
jgi:two-component system sensor histidine kinase AlgZ